MANGRHLVSPHRSPAGLSRAEGASSGERGIIAVPDENAVGTAK